MSFRNDDDFDSSTYVRVNTRLMEFHKDHPKGRVETQYSFHEQVLVVRASLYRDEKDEKPAATGHAFLETLTGEKVGEYTETVAVGRALALMGYSIEKGLASGEEMSRFKERQESKKEEKAETKASPPSSSKIRQSAPAQQKAEEAKTETKVEASETKDAPPEVKKLTTSRIFKPLPKKDVQQEQTGGK